MGKVMKRSINIDNYRRMLVYKMITRNKENIKNPNKRGTYSRIRALFCK